RFAAAAAAGAASRLILRTGQLGRLAHARRHISESGNLDLRARRPGARVPVEDLEDDHGTVHHLAADLLLQVVRLRGVDRVVDQYDVGALFHDCLQLQALAGAEVPRRVEAGVLLGERPHYRQVLRPAE